MTSRKPNRRWCPSLRLDKTNLHTCMNIQWQKCVSIIHWSRCDICVHITIFFITTGIPEKCKQRKLDAIKRNFTDVTWCSYITFWDRWMPMIIVKLCNRLIANWGWLANYFRKTVFKIGSCVKHVFQEQPEEHTRWPHMYNGFPQIWHSTLSLISGTVWLMNRANTHRI